MTKLRVGCLGGTMVAALVVAVLSGTPPRLAGRIDPLAPAVAQQALAAERAAAAPLGMSLEGSGEETLTGATWSHDLQVGPHECVAVLVASWGFLRVTGVVLAGEPGIIVTQRTTGLAAQAQWCERDGRAMQARVTLAAVDPRDRAEYRRGTLRWEVHRAPWDRVGGPLHLVRGEPSLGAFRAYGREAAVDEARPHLPATLVPLGPEVPVTFAGARLLPCTEATRTALVGASRRPAGTTALLPAVDLETSHVPLAEGATDPISAAVRGWPGEAPHLVSSARAPAIHLGDGRFARVLAVVDPSALGRCGTLVFTRLLFGYRAEVTARGLSVRPLPVEENVASDGICPGQAINVYTVPDTDQEEYRLRLYVRPDPVAPDAARQR